MEKYQIEYYHKLEPDEKAIIKIAALQASSIYVSQITEIAQLRLKRKITQKVISVVLEEAAKQKLFTKLSRYNNIIEYRASISFMIYVFPELSDFQSEWVTVNKNTSVYYIESQSILRNFLYSLLHNKQGLAEAQTKVQKVNDAGFKQELTDLFDNSAYDAHLSKLDEGFLQTLFAEKINQYLLELTPITEIIKFCDKIASLVKPEIAKRLPFNNNSFKFFAGEFTISDNNYNSYITVQNAAIQHIINGDAKTALAFFDKSIKLQKADFPNLQFIPNPYNNLYYVTTLLCVDSEESSIRLKKIQKGLEKYSYSHFDFYFKAVGYSLLNETEPLKHTVDKLFSYIKLEYNDAKSLIFICICYLADAKPNATLEKAMVKVVKKAIEGGHLILAYEAAYAMKKWFNNTECNGLYNSIAEKMKYQPAFRLIARQEEWEKSLNILLSLGGAKTAKSAKDKDNSSRVIFYFNPKNNKIQPISQTRNAKGVWSAGRNIALKTFFEAKTPGMTEQDLRISKTIKHYNSYYDNYYDFSEKALVELIGHPYVFLEGGKEIPVELIAAQPEIKVVKAPGGYKLDINIKNLTDRIFVQKETNTRYKVYDLSLQQLDMIKVLVEQKIVVPEHGKEKLIQLLGGISKHATIHSDLISTSTQNTKIVTVEADNKIRVQLLPFGDGLKAELFAKPFGTHPPYCKPGVGGKVLIANENGSQLQVKRDLKQEAAYSNALLEDLQALESIDMTDDLISFEEPLDSLHLLDVIANHKDKCVVEWPEGERFKIRGTANFGNLNLRIKSKANWFELDGELKVNEDTVLTIQQLMALVAKSHDRFIELKDGEFLALSAEMKKRLEELYTFTTKGKDGLQMNKFASMALGDLFDDVENLKTDKAWKEFRQRVDKVEMQDVKVPSTLQAELRPYQEEGFRWMTRLAEWEGGACLADDMGLGKTIQTISILLHRSAVGASLVICPVSVMGNWIAEVQRFAPTLNIKTLGTSNRSQTLDELESGDVLITSYGLLQSEEKLFVEKEFGTIVLDEAHVIKNNATKTSKATMQLKASFRVALTGTPLQNHLGEIWNLFNFVNPGLLGSLQHFNDTFVKPDNEHARKYLRKLIAPFILRRTKSAVLDELPPKTEIVKKIQLSDSEMAFYEALRRQALLNLEGGEGNQGTKHLQVLAEITKLRQASCNPALVDANINIPSSKMAAFLDIVDELIENKHRALVFSQFVTHLSLMRKALDEKGIKYQYLDGSTPIPEREKSVKKFQSGEGELFLISLKAGGLGLNLTSADYVIHLDPWWNPAIEDQASDRAHRIGQTRPVTIYRLVAENTIEEKIIQLHNTKRDLADSLLEGSDQSARMSLNELVSLIQEGF